MLVHDYARYVPISAPISISPFRQRSEQAISYASFEGPAHCGARWSWPRKGDQDRSLVDSDRRLRTGWRRRYSVPSNDPSLPGLPKRRRILCEFRPVEIQARWILAMT